MYQKQIPDIYYDNFEDLIPYSAPLFQSGNGFFTSLRRLAIPLFKRAKPYIKKTAIGAMKNIARRVTEGERFTQAIKRAADDVKVQVLNDVIGSGGPKRKRKKDIFD